MATSAARLKYNATAKGKANNAANSAAFSASPKWNPIQKARRRSPYGKIRSRDGRFRFKGIQNADGTQFTTSNVIDAFFRQNGDCGFCQKPLLEDIYVDHDHASHKFRKLLHFGCNTNLVGKHTLETAKTLVKYMERHP